MYGGCKSKIKWVNIGFTEGQRFYHLYTLKHRKTNDSLCLRPETGNWTCPLLTPKINRSQHTKYLDLRGSSLLVTDSKISCQVHQVGLPHVQVVWILLFTTECVTKKDQWVNNTHVHPNMHGVNEMILQARSTEKGVINK